MFSVCMRFQRRLPSLELSIRIFTLRITEKSSLRHKIEDGGSGLSISWISSNNEVSSLIRLIIVEIFFICRKGVFPVDVTSFEIWINDSSNVPAGSIPDETIGGVCVDDNNLVDRKGEFEHLGMVPFGGHTGPQVSHIYS